MKEYIPLIYKQEIQIIKAEIRWEPSDGSGGEFTRDISIIFNGSTRQGEAIVIVVRFVNDDWCIVRRLIRKGDELAQVLKECLSVDYGVRAD